jgi:nucleoside 2-deoxyribosyltransferase
VKVYFACAIVGGRRDEGLYQQIVQALQDDGHEVPTAMNAGPDWRHMEGLPDPSEVYRRDTEWINEADALVAEVSTPSHGVGYEISYALERGKPVLCLFQRGNTVSKMITGNTTPGITVHEYHAIHDGVEFMREFLKQVIPLSS